MILTLELLKNVLICLCHKLCWNQKEKTLNFVNKAQKDALWFQERIQFDPALNMGWVGSFNISGKPLSRTQGLLHKRVIAVIRNINIWVLWVILWEEKYLFKIGLYVCKAKLDPRQSNNNNKKVVTSTLLLLGGKNKRLLEWQDFILCASPFKTKTNWKGGMGDHLGAQETLFLDLTLTLRTLSLTAISIPKYSVWINLFSCLWLVSLFSILCFFLLSLSWAMTRLWYGLEAFNFLLDSTTNPWVTTIKAGAKRFSQRGVTVSES